MERSIHGLIQTKSCAETILLKTLILRCILVNALHVELQHNLGISGFLPIVQYSKKHNVSEAA
jgi:hypothetical protein